MTAIQSPIASSSSVPGIPGKRVACMGNSIASNGNDPSQSTAEVWGGMTQFSYLLWAILLSGGRLQYAGTFATGGVSSSTIKANWLAAVVAAKPDMCIIGPMMTNDFGLGVSFATTVANMESVISTLLNAGIIPVMCVEPPDNIAANENIAMVQRNLWALRYASRHSLPIIDFYTVLSDTSGNWIPSLNNLGDGLHPNGAGAKVMGQQVVNALVSGTLAPTRENPPLMYSAQVASDTTTLLTNQLLLNNVTTPGVPDNWTYIGGTATSSLAADGSTPAAPRVAARGNLFSVTRGTTDTVATTAALTVTPGDRLHFSAHVEATVEASAGAASFRLVDSGTFADLFSFQFATDIPSGSVMTGEIVVPSTVTAVKAYSATLNAAGAVMKFGQVTLVDLTAQGMTA